MFIYDQPEKLYRQCITTIAEVNLISQLSNFSEFVHNNIETFPLPTQVGSRGIV